MGSVRFNLEHCALRRCLVDLHAIGVAAALGLATFPIGTPLTPCRDLWSGIAQRRATRCLEDQANTSGVVRDVGIICSLTRCRPGLTGVVATRGGYRSGGTRSWSSLPTVSLTPCQGCPARLRLYICGGPRASIGPLWTSELAVS